MTCLLLLRRNPPFYFYEDTIFAGRKLVLRSAMLCFIPVKEVDGGHFLSFLLTTGREQLTANINRYCFCVINVVTFSSISDRINIFSDVTIWWRNRFPIE